MRKWKRVISGFFAMAVCLTAVPAVTVKADYRYDEFDEGIAAQATHVAETNYNGKQLGIGDFRQPADFYVYNDEMIFILDNGNNRVVALDGNFQVDHVIENLQYEGEELDISGAKGIYVSPEGEIYIADTANNRVVTMDQAGQVDRLYTRPDSVLFTDNVTFLPRNVVTDTIGTVYVISENSTQGAYMLNPEGEFLGFYGRNEVDVTADVLFQAAIRKFASEEQRARMSNFIPVEFSSFDADSEGFIYTVTGYSSTPKDSSMIRKLNPLGQNILANEYRTWGDEPEGSVFRTNYVDIAADDSGFIYALDSYNGRVFLYDDTGFQISIFGGAGTQMGTFGTAAAVDTMGSRVLVLDSRKNNLTVFKRTSFGQQLVDGLTLYNQGKMEEALPYFQELVKMDANFFYAYYCMAETYYDMGDYRKAEEYATLSHESQEIYSKAKKMLRNDGIRNHFTAVFLLVILAALGLMAGARVMTVKRKERYWTAVKSGERQMDGFYARMPKWKYPFYILRHPVDGYHELKNNKKFSLRAANVILAAWALLEILNWGYIDFDFRSRFQDVSLPQVLLTTVVIFGMVVVANWCFCTLMEGKGRLPEIWVCCAYALLPYVVCGYIRLILSFLMVYDEAVFLNYLIIIAGVWSFLLFLLGLSVLHDYNLGKTMGSFALTVFGVLIAVFFAVLLSGLIVQIYSFFMTVYSEIRYRML